MQQPKVIAAAPILPSTQVFFKVPKPTFTTSLVSSPAPIDPLSKMFLPLTPTAMENPLSAPILISSLAAAVPPKDVRTRRVSLINATTPNANPNITAAKAKKRVYKKRTVRTPPQSPPVPIIKLKVNMIKSEEAEAASLLLMLASQ